jgi:hypothetical protein
VSLGLEVRTEANMLVSPQPCPAFREGCCSLYQQGRPQTCHTYRCGVLNGYVEGSATLDDGIAVIGLVRSIVREIEIEMGIPIGSHNRALLTDYFNEHQPWDTPAEHARLLVAFARYRRLGEQHFGFEAKPVEQQAAAAGERLAAEDAERG